MGMSVGKEGSAEERGVRAGFREHFLAGQQVHSS